MNQIADGNIAAVAAGKGDCAVGAVIVAAVLDLQERTGPFAGGIGGEEGADVVHGAGEGAAGGLARQGGNFSEKLPLEMGAEDQIHPLHLQDLIRLELGVAAGDGDDSIGVDALEAADDIPAFLVGVLGHRTGVDDVDVGTFGGWDYGVSTGYEFSFQRRSFGVVELAAQSVESDGTIHTAKIIIFEQSWATHDCSKIIVLSVKKEEKTAK